MLTRIDQVETPEIGRYYLVPSVWGYWHRGWAWWPILGTWHEDAKIIGFPKHHYHLDMRFVSKLHKRPFHPTNPDQTPVYMETTLPLQEWDDVDGRAWSRVHPVSPPWHRLSEPELKRKLYKRHMPAYPRGHAPWLTRLEAAYRDHMLKPGLVCPHRGTPLRGLPVDSDGCVTCPLHGLRWNISTGQLAVTHPQAVDYYASLCHTDKVVETEL